MEIDGATKTNLKTGYQKRKEDALFRIQFDWNLELLFLDEDLKNDIEIILQGLVSSSGSSLRLCSDDIRDDKEIINFVLTKIKNYDCIKYVSERLKADKEIVMLAVKSNGSNVQYASLALRNDFEVVMASVKKNPMALQFASVSLKNNEEIVKAAVFPEGFFKQPENYRRKIYPRTDALKYAGLRLLSNEKFMTFLIKHAPRAYPSTSIEIMKKKELAIVGVMHAAFAFKFLPESMQNDVEFVKVCVEKNPGVFKFCSRKMKEDRELVKYFLKKRRMVKIPKCMLGDKEIAFLACQIDGRNILKFSKEIQADLDLLLIVIKKDRSMFNELFPTKLETFSEQCLKIIGVYFVLEKCDLYDKSSIVFQIIVYDTKDREKRCFSFTEKQRDDVDLMRKFFRILLTTHKKDDSGYSRVSHLEEKVELFFKKGVSKGVREDREFVKEIITFFPNLFKHIHPKFYKDKEIVIEALKRRYDQSELFELMDENLLSDKDVYKVAAMYEYGLHKAPVELMCDKEFVMELAKMGVKDAYLFELFEGKKEKRKKFFCYDEEIPEITSDMKEDEVKRIKRLKRRKLLGNLLEFKVERNIYSSREKKDWLDPRVNFSLDMSFVKELELTKMKLHSYYQYNCVPDVLRKELEKDEEFIKQALRIFPNIRYEIQSLKKEPLKKMIRKLLIPSETNSEDEEETEVVACEEKSNDDSLQYALMGSETDLAEAIESEKKIEEEEREKIKLNNVFPKEKKDVLSKSNFRNQLTELENRVLNLESRIELVDDDFPKIDEDWSPKQLPVRSMQDLQCETKTVPPLIEEFLRKRKFSKEIEHEKLFGVLENMQKSHEHLENKLQKILQLKSDLEIEMERKESKFNRFEEEKKVLEKRLIEFETNENKSKIALENERKKLKHVNRKIQESKEQICNNEELISHMKKEIKEMKLKNESMKKDKKESPKSNEICQNRVSKEIEIGKDLLKKFLAKIRMSNAFQALCDANITYDDLPFIQIGDLEEIFPVFFKRSRFFSSVKKEFETERISLKVKLRDFGVKTIEGIEKGIKNFNLINLILDEFEVPKTREPEEFELVMQDRRRITKERLSLSLKAWFADFEEKDVECVRAILVDLDDSS